MSLLLTEKRVDREGIPEAIPLPKRQSPWCVQEDHGCRRDIGELTDCIGGKKVSTKEKRWYKDVGLGFKTPSEAISGTYIGPYPIFTPVDAPRPA